MPKCWVYSGLPGSGKTTLIAKRHPDAKVFSADHHFRDESGEYCFKNPKQVHQKLLRLFTDQVSTCWGKSLLIAEGWNPRSIGQAAFVDIVVDNTNTRVAELAPYMALAEAHGYETTLVTVKCPPWAAWKRQLHGVPRETFNLMEEQLARLELPPWWKHEVVEAEGVTL